MYDITWCANSEKCKRKDCERRLSKRPKNLGCWYSCTNFYEEDKECKYYLQWEKSKQRGGVLSGRK